MYSRYLILLSLAYLFMFSMLLQSSPWPWSNNLIDLKINTVLAIPNVPGNNDTSNITSTTATNYPPESYVGPTSNDTSLNNKPIAQSMNLTTVENEPIEFKLNATDQDQGDILNYTVILNPRFGNITFFDPQTGEGLFRPLLPQDVGIGGATLFDAGSDAFVFKATDSKGDTSNSATVTIRSVSE